MLTMSDEDKKRLSQSPGSRTSARRAGGPRAMAESVPDWTLPRELQPQAEHPQIRSGRRSAFCRDAARRGAGRCVHGVVARHRSSRQRHRWSADGLVLTIGYLITECDTIWISTMDRHRRARSRTRLRLRDRLWPRRAPLRRMSAASRAVRHGRGCAGRRRSAGGQSWWPHGHADDEDRRQARVRPVAGEAPPHRRRAVPGARASALVGHGATA